VQLADPEGCGQGRQRREHPRTQPSTARRLDQKGFVQEAVVAAELQAETTADDAVADDRTTRANDQHPPERGIGQELNEPGLAQGIVEFDVLESVVGAAYMGALLCPAAPAR